MSKWLKYSFKFIYHIFPGSLPWYIMARSRVDGFRIFMSLSYLYTKAKNLLTVIFSMWLKKYELEMVWTHFFFFFLMYFSWANSVLSLNVVLLSMSCWTISLNTHEWTCEQNLFVTTYEHLKTFMNNSTNCSACCRVLLLFYTLLCLSIQYNKHLFYRDNFFLQYFFSFLFF